VIIVKELTRVELLLYLTSYYLNFPLVKPRFVNFGLTHRCNLRCAICETWETNPHVERELSLPELERVITEIASWGDINVSFAGGEPFVRREDLLACVKYAKKLGLTTHITTNGTLINGKIAKQIIASGVDYLQISLDGACAATNDLLRGRGTFNRAMAAIKCLLKCKERTGSELKLSLTTVVTAINLDELLDIYELVNELGLHEVAYNPYVIDTSYTKNKKYEEDEFWIHGYDLNRLRSVCKKLIELKKMGGRIGTPLITLRYMADYFERKKMFNSGLCLAGYSYMYVKPYGEVDVCGKGPSLSVRNHSIKAIWFSPAFAKTRLKIIRCKRPCLMLCFPRVSWSDIWGG
jgi:MoaA/NifB/PqqE/SkfB family radical SAM enzyme